MEHLQYWPVQVTPDKHGHFLVSFPDLREALTEAESLDAALEEASDCLEEALAGRINRGEDIPMPGKATRTDHEIFLDPHFMLKVLLYKEWKAANITKTELARRMDSNEGEARRLLDPRYGSKLSQMEKAFAALGARITISLEKVA